MENTDSDYPYRDTTAANLLAGALRRKQAEGVSLRKLAPALGYKQATVLSHMANGRIQVPIGKAPEIASAVGLSPSEFLIAVLDQRQPDTHMLLTSFSPGCDLPDSFADELEEIAGCTLDSLTAEQKDIMRKVVVDPSPARRWLSEAELPTLQLLRRLRPESQSNGIGPVERDQIAKALNAMGPPPR